MLQYVSTKGGVSPVDFETAVLRGFADDGGLFVPREIPQISDTQLHGWSRLSFNELAFELLSLYIDNAIIPSSDLQKLISDSTKTFSHPDIIPVVPLGGKTDHWVMELFHGPTLSFKDVAMGFLINTMDYLLDRRGESASLLLATTGDTGPAAAYASCGRKTIDCWALYPREFISEEQERQMTTLGAANVHAVAVENCPDGGDDLDIVIARMFEDRELVKNLRLSSVNSINWCRVLFQTVHYFYGYFQVVQKADEQVVFSVPTGGCGNLFAGYLAREMGLPVQSFICANNKNAAVHRVLETGTLSRKRLQQSPSNAIDIAVPYNYWRFLYFVTGQDSTALTKWMREYQNRGAVTFDEAMMKRIKYGFQSVAVSDEDTLSTMAETYRETGGYLLDPHGAVAVAAANALVPAMEPGTKVITLLTAHPAKFPDTVRRALHLDGDLPPTAVHESLEKVKNQFQHVRICDCSQLRSALIHDMSQKSAKNYVVRNVR